MYITGQIGRAGFGTLELGRPIHAFRGAVVTFSFNADGQTSLVSFDSTHDPMVQDGSFDTNGSATATFLMGLAVACVFTTAGSCTAIFISGDGAVAITCLVNGATIMTNPFAGFLFDAPYSY